MSAVKKSSPQAGKVTEVFYTICPQLVASHVAIETGSLAADLKKIGVKFSYIRTLPQEKWIAHYTHQLPNLFRDGGNTPPIWAKSRGEDIKVIGLTFNRSGGEIIVRADADIFTVKELKGKRIGLPTRVKKDRVDFWRATAHRGILSSLRLAGLTAKDVEIVEILIDGPDYPSACPIKKPSDAWKQQKNYAEDEALLDGTVDAIYSSPGKSLKLQRDGIVKSIENLEDRPDWTLQPANTPSTITVNTELAEKHPEIVIGYLKSVIKTGRWINTHPKEAGEIFSKVTAFPDKESAARDVAKYDLVPNLSSRNIASLEIEKKFYLEQGYISKDFDLKDLIDGRYLEAALKSR